MSWVDPREAARLRLGAAPTPLEPHPRLGRELGVELFLKREDLIDDTASGNKVRKLEYVIADALQEGADTLVTGGSAQSNQAKAVAVHARRQGLDCHVVFCDEERPAAARGNYLVDALLGPRITWIPNPEWPRMPVHLEAARQAELARGRRPYVIPPGASGWLGTLGQVRLGRELAEQESRLGLKFDCVVAPTGSGGTHCGLVVGRELAGRDWRVFGVAVLGRRAYFEQRHQEILDELAREAGLVPTEAMRRVDVHDGAVGGGYGSYTREDLDELVRVARAAGLILDPVYMLKVWRGLRQLVEGGAIARGSTVVMVHTGGQYGLFGQSGPLDAYLRDRSPGWLGGGEPG